LLDGIEGEWVGGLEARRLSLPVPKAYRLERVSVLSSFGEAGLKRGDFVLGLNDKDFPAAGKIWDVFLESARNDKPVKMKVLRDNSEKEIIYQPEIQE